MNKKDREFYEGLRAILLIVIVLGVVIVALRYGLPYMFLLAEATAPKPGSFRHDAGPWVAAFLVVGLPVLSILFNQAALCTRIAKSLRDRKIEFTGPKMSWSCACGGAISYNLRFDNTRGRKQRCTSCGKESILPWNVSMHALWGWLNVVDFIRFLNPLTRQCPKCENLKARFGKWIKAPVSIYDTGKGHSIWNMKVVCAECANKYGNLEKVVHSYTVPQRTMSIPLNKERGRPDIYMIKAHLSEYGPHLGRAYLQEVSRFRDKISYKYDTGYVDDYPGATFTKTGTETAYYDTEYTPQSAGELLSLLDLWEYTRRT